MPPKSRQERLFGAACVYVTLERAGYDPDSQVLYQDTLRDLELAQEDVRAYLADERPAVEAALDTKGARR